MCYNKHGETMKLIYNNKQIYMYNATTFKSRLIGFMFKKNINKAILFKKCRSIHTFFMKSNIDVIMCNNNNEIIYYYKNLTPNKVILPKKNVSYVIELPINYFDIKLNTKIIISSYDPK